MFLCKSSSNRGFLIVFLGCLVGCARENTTNTQTVFDNPISGKMTMTSSNRYDPNAKPVDTPQRLAHDTKIADEEYGKGNYTFGTPYVAPDGCLTRPIYPVQHPNNANK